MAAAAAQAAAAIAAALDANNLILHNNLLQILNNVLNFEDAKVNAIINIGITTVDEQMTLSLLTQNYFLMNCLKT
jgi:acetylglutamate kinase